MIGIIYFDNIGFELYKKFNFIIENNNRDIVVFDLWSVVVVMEGGWGYWFIYIGYLVVFLLYGICIDVLLYILVCDYVSVIVYMFDKNGYFVLYIVSVI